MPEPSPPGDSSGEPGETVHLLLPAILDHHATSLVRLRFDDILIRSPDTLVLDCSAVRFADSGGLRLLLEATRTGRDYGTTVLTYDPNRALAHLLNLVDIEDELVIVVGEVPAPTVDLRDHDI